MTIFYKKHGIDTYNETVLLKGFNIDEI